MPPTRGGIGKNEGNPSWQKQLSCIGLGATGESNRQKVARGSREFTSQSLWQKWDAESFLSYPILVCLVIQLWAFFVSSRLSYLLATGTASPPENPPLILLQKLEVPIRSYSPLMKPIQSRWIGRVALLLVEMLLSF